MVRYRRESRRAFQGGVSFVKVNDIGEFGLISRLTLPLASGDSRIVKGVGDDTAVFRHGSDRLLLATTDAQIEGIHFTKDGFSPEQIGKRAAAVNLSDIAAMGGRPLFALVSLATPEDTPVEWLERIYAGLIYEFKREGVEIIGGNTAELPERLLLDITLLGEVDEAGLLCRDGAQVGDLLCVTGELGRSAAGLVLQSQPSLIEDKELVESARLAHAVPRPRLREGAILGHTGKITSCIDISDGVLGDARHIARQSGVTVEIELRDLPVAEEARLVSAKIGKDFRVFALTGGEDFELMFTLQAKSVSEVFARLQKATDCSPRVIGRIRPGEGNVRVTENGRQRTVSENGYRHFL